MTSGIYVEENLSCLKNHIIFPIEWPSALNIITRGSIGETIPAGNISMQSLGRTGNQQDSRERRLSTLERIYDIRIRERGYFDRLHDHSSGETHHRYHNSRICLILKLRVERRHLLGAI